MWAPILSAGPARQPTRPGGRRYPAGVITWRNGTVSRLRREWPGAIELEVTVSAADGTAPVQVRALAYPALTGRPEPGERVLLNTTALDLRLGTGGYALVAAIPDRLPTDRSGPGHLVKARYTPLQAVVQGADEQGSPYHAVLRDAEDIGGMPVVVADLHSALAPVLAGLYDAMERAADHRPAAALPAGPDDAPEDPGARRAAPPARAEDSPAPPGGLRAVVPARGAAPRHPPAGCARCM